MYWWPSGWLPAAGYFGHLAEGTLGGDVDPAGVAVVGDADLDERVEGALVDAVAAVGEPVTVVPADPGREQCRVEYLVELAAELGLDRVGLVERSMSRAITAR